MKKYLTLTAMVLSIICCTLQAQTVGSAFSYQGELLNNGSPANGDYNFKVVLYDAETDGNDVTSDNINNVPVVNGLFTLELDFGDVAYENNEQYWIDIIITPSAGGSGEQLSPRTKLLSVPYATQALFTNDSDSPWDVNGSFITTTDSVGIGSDTPSDRLHLNSEAGENPFRIQVNSITKLRVLSNGGTTLGTNNISTTPDNGLYVLGDVKQSNISNGLPKFMMRANCDATPTIMRQYNGTHIAGTATIIRNANLTCDITMPFDVGDFFISVTPRYIGASTERFANCNPIGSTLICKMFSGAGNTTAGAFDILLY